VSWIGGNHSSPRNRSIEGHQLSAFFDREPEQINVRQLLWAKDALRIKTIYIKQ